jgi:hypothetical protein
MRKFVFAVVGLSCAALLGLAAVAVGQTFLSATVADKNVCATLSAGQKLAVEALIKDFGSKEFAVRQKAVDRLIELGPDVVPLVRKTLAETADNEVKLRCEMVLKGIKEKFGDKAVAESATGGGAPPVPQAVKPAPGGKLNLDASKITVTVKDADLSDVLGKFADQSGNALIAAPQNWEGKTVTLNLKDTPYWQALDEVCKVAGLTYDAGGMGGMGAFWGGGIQVLGGQRAVRVPQGPAANGGAVTLRPAEKIVDVGSYLGPVVVKLESATKNRNFRTPPTTAVASYNLVYLWEDRLPVISHEGVVTKALDAKGQPLKLQDFGGMGGGMGALMMRRGMRVVIGGQGGGVNSSGTIDATLIELPEGLDKIGELDGTIKLELGTGEKSLKIEDALNPEKTGSADGLTLTVTNVNKQRGGVSLTVEATRDGKEIELATYASRTYGVFLVAPDGTKHQGNVFPGMGGRMMIQMGGPGGGNPPPPQGGANVAVRAGPGMPQGGTTVSFWNLPDVEGAWTLLYVYPSETVSKEFEFKLTNVPLP